MPQDIYIQKATDTRTKHARMLNIKSSLLRTAFGWATFRMCCDIRREYQSHCPLCHNPYKELRDITLDIKNPKQDPVYDKNTQWICGICNSKKRCHTQNEYISQQANINN